MASLRAKRSNGRTISILTDLINEGAELGNISFKQPGSCSPPLCPDPYGAMGVDTPRLAQIVSVDPTLELQFYIVAGWAVIALLTVALIIALSLTLYCLCLCWGPLICNGIRNCFGACLTKTGNWLINASCCASKPNPPSGVSETVEMPPMHTEEVPHNYQDEEESSV